MYRTIIFFCLFISIVLHSYFVECLVESSRFLFSSIDMHRAMKMHCNTPKNQETYDDHFSNEFASMADSMRYFREYARRGLQRFQERDLDGAILDLQRAAKANSTQPLSQLGIFLYCAGQYKEAEIQLGLDIEKIEAAKMFKATDLRLWRCASLNKLGRSEHAKQALDTSYLTSTGLVEYKPLMNITLQFYGGDAPVEELLDFIGSADERDFSGNSFFGNFYLGLYYDSVGEVDLSRTFLSLSKSSSRYPVKDMWYHLPRVLYEQRFATIAA
jgi:hypothetical protein